MEPISPADMEAVLNNARGVSTSDGQPKAAGSMAGFRKHPIRGVLGLVHMFTQLSLAAIEYFVRVLPVRGAMRERAATRWLQRTARRSLRVFNIEVDCRGRLPRSGLLVCNHLSYADILVLGALMPARFVSKGEVKHWPVFGWFATRGRTIYIDRRRRKDVGRVGEAMTEALASHELVVLFPEGTSTDGSGVLPFKTSLLEPAARTRCPVSAARLEFALDEGDAVQEVCYWGDMTLGPHLLNLLARGKVRARITCTPVKDAPADRKQLAERLRAEVLRLGSRQMEHQPSSSAGAESGFAPLAEPSPAA